MFYALKSLYLQRFNNKPQTGRMKISIVIPIYNKEKYVEACFESLLKQDFDSFEIVAVDDGSTDRSGEICDRMAERDSRIRVFHTPNGGVTAARRKGVEQATGDYIMFADADDLFTPNALSIMYDSIIKSDADEVIGTYDNQYEHRNDSGLRGFVEPEHLIRDLLGLRSQFCVLWGIIFRRELLEGCLNAPREIIEREDSLMQIKCLMKNPKVYFIAESAYMHYDDVPNMRRETIDWIRIYDEELRKTLEPQWNIYKSAFVGHQIKVYEKFIDCKQFHVLNEYYRPLRKQLSNNIPLMDRIAILLPPRLSYFLIHYYKIILRWI